MEVIQELHERAVGDALVNWLNADDGACRVFLRRGDPAPDLIYEFNGKQLGVEVVGAYYDESDASYHWQNARNRPNAPSGWHGVNFDCALARSIERHICEKCVKSYGSDCLLLVSVRPA